MLTIYQAVDKYDINPYTARSYMREYRDLNKLLPMNKGREEFRILKDSKRSKYENLCTSFLSQKIVTIIK